MESRAYYGSVPCSGVTTAGKACGNRAYFLTNGLYRCGVHSDKKNRIHLPKNTLLAEQNRVANFLVHFQSVKEAADISREEEKPGQITCYKMRMMKDPPLVPGVINVFPNNKHQNRKDGFGCSSLSPMRLGPVEHGQPGVPAATNIENYHQFNKVWPCELSGVVPKGELDVDNFPAPMNSFWVARTAGYLDPVPHRHKFPVVKGPVGVNSNTPCYSVHATLTGDVRRFTYVQSRYFYCIAYEKLATTTEDFAKLIQMVSEGMSICICGYDAFEVTEDLYSHYCDSSRAFGHELVLYALLEHAINPEVLLPWHRYHEEHPSVYAGMI